MLFRSEGELGVLAGVEDEVSSDHHTYTDPEEVIDFATRTGCDSLAISIGTSQQNVQMPGFHQKSMRHFSFNQS